MPMSAGSAQGEGMAAMTQVDASAALQALARIEESAHVIATDAAALLGGLQNALQAVSYRPSARSRARC